MIYSKLEPPESAIRLLRLRSRSYSASHAAKPEPLVQDPVAIHCELYHAWRDQTVPYTALSYVWGNPNDTVSVTVNDTAVQITSNLHCALEHIREEDKDVILWIDALCINQEDADEKGEQVRQMQNIYANASRTIAFLGPRMDKSDEFLAEFRQKGEYSIRHGIYDLMIELATLPSTESEQYSKTEAQIKERLAGLLDEAFADLPGTLTFLTAAQHLFARPYWTRVWVIQEFVVSANLEIQCGRVAIPFPPFHAAVFHTHMLKVNLMQRIYRRLTEPDTAVEATSPDLVNHFFAIGATEVSPSANTTYGLRHRYQSSKHNASDSPTTLIHFLSKVFISARPQASDDRDRIFALLGMAKDTADLGLIPEYGNSVKSEDVFTKAARAIISAGQVDLLSFVQRRDDSEVLPSWVPDWRGTILRPCGQLPWDTSFSACGNKIAPSVEYGAHSSGIAPGRFLILCGYSVDTISAVKSPWRPGPDGCSKDTDGINRYLTEIAELCSESDELWKLDGIDVYSNPGDRETALVRVPIADMEQYGVGFIRRADYHFCKKGQECVQEDIERTKQGVPVESNVDEKSSYMNMMGWQWNRRPFLSTMGYIGLAPDLAEAGDRVVIFSGGKFPYIIRKLDGGSGYRLVGEAYVHGIMYGELLCGKDDIDAEQFVLN